MRKALRWGVAFLHENTRQSMARLCAFILCLTTVLAVWLGRDAATIAALVGGGVVALLSRKKAADPVSDE